MTRDRAVQENERGDEGDVTRPNAGWPTQDEVGESRSPRGPTSAPEPMPQSASVCDTDGSCAASAQFPQNLVREFEKTASNDFHLQRSVDASEAS